MNPSSDLFKKSLQAARDGDISVHLVFVLHPQAYLISGTEPRDGEPPTRWADGGIDPVAAWRGPSAPWLGAALWAHPRHFEQDLIEARCGALFSFAHCPSDTPELNEAFNEHLGPWGCQVSGSKSNPSAFEGDGFPLPLSIISCDTRSGSSFTKEGGPRPSHWPEPYPLLRRLWRPEEGPPNAPDFQAAALATARMIRLGVAQAMREEGVSEAVIEALGGGVAPVPGEIARLFNRQEHPMFGATALKEGPRQAALGLFDIARGAFEAERIAAVTLPGSAPPKGSRL